MSLEDIFNRIMNEDYVNTKAKSEFQTNNDLREMNKLPMFDYTEGIEVAPSNIRKRYGDILYRLPLNITFGYMCKVGIETFRKVNDDFYYLCTERGGTKLKDEYIHYMSVAKWLSSRRGWATGVIRIFPTPNIPQAKPKYIEY